MPKGFKYANLFDEDPNVIIQRFNKEFLDPIGKAIDQKIKQIETRVNAIKIDPKLTGTNIKSQGTQTTQIESLRKEKEAVNELQKEYARLKTQQEKLNAKVTAAPTGSYAKMNAELSQTIYNYKRLSQAERENAQSGGLLLNRIKTLQTELKRLDATMGVHTRNVGNYKSALVGVGASLKNFASSLISVYAAINIGRKLFEDTRELNSLAFSLKVLVTNTRELAETQDFLSSISERFGLDILKTSQSYVRFRASIAGTNFDLKESQKLFESVSKAGAVLGLRADRMQLVFLALEQMISKGTISTEELRRQLGDLLPGSMNIMARALGVTVPKLLEMVKANQVLANEALPKFRVELEKTYGIENLTKVNTLESAVGRLRNSWLDFVKTVNASKISTEILNGLRGLLDAFSSPELVAQRKGLELYNDKLNVINKSLDETRKRSEQISKDMKETDAQAGERANKSLAAEIYRYWLEATDLLGYYQEKVKGLSTPDQRAALVAYQKLAKELDDMWNNLGKKEGEDSPAAVQMGVIEELNQKIKTNNELIEKSTDLTGANQQMLKSQNEEYEKQIKWLTELIDLEKIQKEWLEEAEESIKSQVKTQDLGIESDMAAIQDEIDAVIKAYDKEQEALKSRQNRKDQFYRSVRKMDGDAYREQLVFLNEFLKDGNITEEQYLAVRLQMWMDYNRDAIDASKNLQDELFNMSETLIDIKIDELKNTLDAYDQEIDALKGKLDDEKSLKDQGKANDYDRLVKQIADEQKLRDDAQKKYEIYQKRQAQIKFLETQANLGVAVAEAFAAGAGEGPAGWIMAIAAAAALITAFASMQAKIKSIGAYAEGTEFVERGGNKKGRDTIPAWLDEGERVVPAGINKKLEGVDNERLPEIYSLYKYNMLRGVGVSEGYSEMLSELQKSRTVSERMLNHMEETPTVTPLGPDKILLSWGKHRTQVVNLKR